MALQKKSVSWASKETEEGELKINSTLGKVLVVLLYSESTKHYSADARTFNSRKAEAMSLRTGESVVSFHGSALGGEKC